MAPKYWSCWLILLILCAIIEGIDDFYLRKIQNAQESRTKQLMEGIISVLEKGSDPRYNSYSQLHSSLLGVVDLNPPVLSDKLTEYLLELFWILHETIQDGRTSKDGKVGIGGKTYDLSKLGSYCCSFG